MSEIINFAERRKEKQQADNDFKTVFQFKVTVKSIHIPIWRRIIVPENISFHTLHEIVLQLMGWDNTKEHIFHTHDPRTKEDFTIGVKKKTRINHLLPEYTEKISNYLSIKNQYIYYEYNIPNGWELEIMFEKVFPRDYRACYPFCVDGKNAAPAKTCSTPEEYNLFLDILQQPGHTEYKKVKNADFDPFTFDCTTVQCKIAKTSI